MGIYSTLKVSLTTEGKLDLEIGPRVTADSFEEAQLNLNLQGLSQYKVQYEIVFEDEEELEKLTLQERFSLQMATYQPQVEC